MEKTKCYLLQKTNEPDPLIISLDQDEITVGRKTFCKIGNPPEISRKHASFQVNDRGQWFVKDLNSTNGVFINDVKIGPGLHALTNGDIIGFAPVEFDFTFCSDNSAINNVVSTSSSASSSNIDDVEPTARSNSGNILSKREASRSREFTGGNNSLSYKRKYADIINSEFPKVILEKCPIPVKENSQEESEQPDEQWEALPWRQRVKRRRIRLLSSSSDSDSESVLNKWETSSSSAGMPTKQNIPPRLTASLISKSNTYDADMLPQDELHEQKPGDFFTPTGPTESIPTITSVYFNPGEQSLNDDWLSNNILTKLEEVECPNEIIQDDHEKEFVTSEHSQRNISNFSNFPFQQSLSVGGENTSMICNETFEHKNPYVKEVMTSPCCTLLPEIKKEALSPAHENYEYGEGNEVLHYNNVKVEVERHLENVNKSHHEDFSYSQEDEVVVISDDDNYFSVPSSQPEVFANLKTEPPEDEIEEFNQDFEENEGIETFTPADDGIFDLVNHTGEESQESENINNIEKFLSKPNSRPPVKESKENKEFFPEFPEDFFNSSSESSDEGSSSTNKNHLPKFAQTSSIATSKVRTERFPYNDEDSSTHRNNIKRKPSKIMLTDPKPMEYRPRYQRGREEWFEDHYSERPCTGSKTPSAEAEKSPNSKNVANKKKVMKAVAVKVKKNYFSKKRKEQMVHNSRAPIGKSALPLSNKQAPSTSSVSDAFMHTNKAMKSIPERTISETTNIHCPRAPTVKTRPEKFCSRMQFLVDSDGKHNNKNDFKIPKLKNSDSNETSRNNTSKVTSRNKLQPKDTSEKAANKDLLKPRKENADQKSSNSGLSSNETSRNNTSKVTSKNKLQQKDTSEKANNKDLLEPRKENTLQKSSHSGLSSDETSRNNTSKGTSKNKLQPKDTSEKAANKDLLKPRKENANQKSSNSGLSSNETSRNNTSKVTSENRLQPKDTSEKAANKDLLEPRKENANQKSSHSGLSSSDYSNSKKYHQELSNQQRNIGTGKNKIDLMIESDAQPIPEKSPLLLPVAKVVPSPHSAQKLDSALFSSKPNCIQDPRLQRHAEQENRKTSTQVAVSGSSSTFHNSVSHSSTTIASTLPMLSNLSVQIDDDVLVGEIIGWNPLWLKEYVDYRKPPRKIRQGAIPLPLFFTDLQEYALCFYALIRLEIWESIFLFWKEHISTNIVLLRVTESELSGEHMTLQCESFIPSSVSHEPKQGSLMVIDLRVRKCKEVIKVFGYVTDCKTVPNHRINASHEAWKRKPEIFIENFKLITFTLKTKKKLVQLDFNMLMKAQLLNYIANKVRIVNIFKYMMTSPIYSCILQPNEEAYSLNPTCSASRGFSLIGNYNEQQKKAIVSIWNGIKLDYWKPKVILLQGPPGTGKTHTIVGVVEALHNKEHKDKILITAPSNAAVDEIGRRLIDLKHSCNLQLSDLKIVRVGQNIHPHVLPYFLDKLAKKNAERDVKKQEDSLKKENSKVTAAIEKLQLEIHEMEINFAPYNDIMEKKKKLKFKNRQQHNIMDKIRECQRNSSIHVSEYDRKRVLEEADVILTTLSSCGISILSSVFGPNSSTNFTFCIVDEATQCTEPEILQPLLFGLTKFVLVGDHQQLPATVQSRLASDLNFGRSLFERVHLYFQKSCKKSPIFMLDTQYRMHSEICKFPSSHFYSHKLVTAPDVDSRYSHFPFKPFTILDIVYSQESNCHSSKTNVLEAEAIIEICKQLVKKIPENCSVGIITPYQAQKDIYIKALSRYSSAVNSMEVNTVDSFQGREKDVIILSCVRAQSCTGSIGFLACSKRLNVAITRAKQCLIICGHMKSLKQYPLWANLITYAEERNCCMSVTDTEDISFVLNEMRK